jgi:hypothetical protein
MERGLSILWIDAICGSVQNSMTPPEKPAPAPDQVRGKLRPGNVVRRVGKPTLYERGLPSANIPASLRMILSLVPLTPAAAPPNRRQGCVFTREFPLRIKRRGVEMRFAIDAPDPRATNPDPVLLNEVQASPPLLRRPG